MFLLHFNLIIKLFVTKTLKKINVFNVINAFTFDQFIKGHFNIVLGLLTINQYYNIFVCLY